MYICRIRFRFVGSNSNINEEVSLVLKDKEEGKGYRFLVSLIWGTCFKYYIEVKLLHSSPILIRAIYRFIWLAKGKRVS